MERQLDDLRAFLTGTGNHSIFPFAFWGRLWYLIGKRTANPVSQEDSCRQQNPKPHSSAPPAHEWLGGICAAIGLCIPAVVTLTIVTAIYDAIKDNYWVWSALKGVQCAVAPIIGGAAISLGKDALTSAMPIIICAVAFVLCYFTSISNLTLVVAGVVIALVWMGVSEHGHV